LTRAKAPGHACPYSFSWSKNVCRRPVAHPAFIRPGMRETVAKEFGLHGITTVAHTQDDCLKNNEAGQTDRLSANLSCAGKAQIMYFTE